MRNFKEEAIIIKRRNYGEADRMLTVFTKNYGKMSVVAKGVRRITSRRASHIELLNHSVLYVYKGKGLPVLGEAQVLSNHGGIKEDLTKVGFAYHICELIDGFCPDNQENRSVFHLLLSTLERLSNLAYSSSERSESRSNNSVILGSSASQNDSRIHSINSGQVDFGQARMTGGDDLVSIIHDFEIELLSTLGFFPRYKHSYNFNTVSFIENILERKLKSRQILSQLT